MVHPIPRAPVRPTAQDEVAAAGSELIGGPAGRHTAADSGGWWSPVRVVALVGIGMFTLGMVQKAPCVTSGWFHSAAAQYTHACYSDIPHLYRARGFAAGVVPYFDRIPEHLSGGLEYLEYPVLTGMFMEVAAWLTPGGTSAPKTFWLFSAGILMVCAVVTVVSVARSHQHRPWDALLVALAPALALTATINWDLLAVALTSAGLLQWARFRPLASGVFLGLGTAAKFYPVLLLCPLLALCWRAGRLREFGMAAAGAVGAWLVVNLPFMVLAPRGWATFYTFSHQRGIDFGSFWLLLTRWTDAPLDGVNTAAGVLVAVGCAAIALLALRAPHRPRLGQLAFLVVALFIVTNKIYSPQYVLWLIPLAVLARPRWRDILFWQTCEVLYYLAIWMYLAHTHTQEHQGLPPDGYHLAIVLHLAGTLGLCVVVVRDVLRPERDPVRRDGSDDPGGGVLDGAVDMFTLRRRPVSAPASSAYVEWGATPETLPPHPPRDVSRETR